MNHQNIRIKLSVYAAAILTMGALAIVSGLADIAEAFPDINIVLIQVLITLPVLVQIPVSLLCSRLCRYQSPKTLMLIACLAFTAGGCAPFFIHIFPVIMLLRGMIGIGIGLIIPLLASVTVIYFEGAERASVMGVYNALGMLGGMFFTYAGGILSEIGWQYCFLAYGIGLPVFFIILILMPDEKMKQYADNSQSKCRLNAEVYWIAALTMFYLAFYFAYINNISLLVANTGMGTASDSGIAYSVANGCGFLAGLVYGRISRKIHHWVVPLCIAVTMTGFVIIAASPGFNILYAGSILVGIGLGWMLPECSVLIGEIVPYNASAYAFGVNGAIVNCGQFLSVIMINGIAVCIGVKTERGMLYIAAVGYLLLLIISIFYISIRNKTTSGGTPPCGSTPAQADDEIISG